MDIEPIEELDLGGSQLGACRFDVEPSCSVDLGEPIQQQSGASTGHFSTIDSHTTVARAPDQTPVDQMLLAFTGRAWEAEEMTQNPAAPTTPLGSVGSFGTAVVSGASSGIGAATAIALSTIGFDVVIGARRVERLSEVAKQCPGPVAVHQLDVTDDGSVNHFVASIPECHVLINNAGGALGVDPIATADIAKWQTMYDTNLLGTLRLTKGLLDKLTDSGNGHVVVVGSIAGIESYRGGAGYNAAKAAQHSFCEVLRQETVGLPIRVSEVQPGLVETEFSVVRFDGDQDRADAVYEGLTPLSALDVADLIAFIVTRPPHVNLATTLLLPRDQATVAVTHRS